MNAPNQTKRSKNPVSNPAADSITAVSGILANRLSPKFVPWFPYLFILLLTIVFFFPVIFHGKVFLAADTLYSYFPWRYYASPDFRPHNPLITDPINGGYPVAYNRQLKEGRLRQWNPLILGGVPVVNSPTTGSAGRYYPVTLIGHYLFNPNVALMIVFFVQTFLMGAFMHLYLLEIGAGHRGALFGAIVWMFSGTAMVWFSFQTVMGTGAFLPLLLFVMERFLSPRRIFWAFAGALVLGLIFLMGHTQYVMYVGMMMIFYAIFLTWRAWRTGGGFRDLRDLAVCFAITSAGGILIGAIDLLPMSSILANSSRISRSFDFKGLFNTLGQVPFRWLVTLVFPEYYGTPVSGFNIMPSTPHQEYMNYNELCWYLGVPTLFALLGVCFGWRKRFVRFHLGLTVLMVLMLAGTWAFWPFFTFFPGLDKVNPTRLIFLFTFVAAVSAGLGIESMTRLSRKGRIWFAALAAGLLVCVVILALVSTKPEIISFFNQEQINSGRIQPSALTHFIQILQTKRALASPLIKKPLLLTALAALLAIVYVLLPGRRRSWGIFALFAVLLAYDLISFGWRYTPAISPKYLYPPTPSIEFLHRQPGPFRVVQDTGSGLYVNTLAPFDIEELGGYVNAYPDRVNKLYSSMEFGERAVLSGRAFDRWVMFRRHTSPLYDLMNVRYLLTSPYKIGNDPKYKLVFREDLAVWENTKVLPRAFAVHRAVVRSNLREILEYMNSPTFAMDAEVVLETPLPLGQEPPGDASGFSDSVSITRYEYDEIDISADLGEPGWVVVSNTWYPGWRASVDGAEASLLRADCSIMAVKVPSGKHVVKLRFQSSSLTLGMSITLFGLLFSGGGLAAMQFFRRRRSRIRDKQP